MKAIIVWIKENQLIRKRKYRSISLINDAVCIVYDDELQSMTDRYNDLKKNFDAAINLMEVYQKESDELIKRLKP